MMISFIDRWEEKAGLPLELGDGLADLLCAKIPLTMQKWQWISRPSNTKKDDDGWSLYPQLTQQKQERWYLRDPSGWITVDTFSVAALLTITSLLSLMRVWHSSHVTRSREVHSLHLKITSVDQIFKPNYQQLWRPTSWWNSQCLSEW